LHPKTKGGEVPNSFGRYLLEKQKVLGLSDNEAAYLAGSLFGAGSETTASSISVSIMAAACYPEAQQRVQEELNSIVGLDRGKMISIPCMATQLIRRLQLQLLQTLRTCHRCMRLFWKLSDGDLLALTVRDVVYFCLKTFFYFYFVPPRVQDLALHTSLHGILSGYGTGRV
jgi:hypothetical protein